MEELPKGWLAEVFKEAAEVVNKMPKEDREYYEKYSRVGFVGTEPSHAN